eukprot:c16242_g1_i1 orf=1-285(-)
MGSVPWWQGYHTGVSHSPAFGHPYEHRSYSLASLLKPTSPTPTFISKVAPPTSPCIYCINHSLSFERRHFCTPFHFGPISHFQPLWMLIDSLSLS